MLEFAILGLIICLILLWVMQLGFMLLETGSVQDKNSFHVSIKNLVDAPVAVMATLALSALLTNQEIFWRPVWAEKLPRLTETIPLVLGMYAATSLTILSGAWAERMRIRAYLIYGIAHSLLLFPILQMLAWSNLGFLTHLGFLDQAGSTVIHAAAGGSAWMGCRIIGPRLHFREMKKSAVGGDLPINNATFVSGSIFLLTIGWIGFNISTLIDQPQLALQGVYRTILFGLAGLLAGLLWSALRAENILSLRPIVTASLAGLVASSAAFHTHTNFSAFLTGLLAGVAALLFQNHVIAKYAVDDPVEAISTHFAGGVMGTLAAALVTHFPEPSLLTTLKHIGIQSIGILTLTLTSACLTGCFLIAIGKFTPLRPQPADEKQGLNIAEHGSPSPLDELTESILRESKDLSFQSTPKVDPWSNAGRVGAAYQTLLFELRSRIHQHFQSLEHLSQLGTEIAALSHDIRTPLQVISGQAYQLHRKAEKLKIPELERHALVLDEAYQRMEAQLTDVVRRTTKRAHQKNLTSGSMKQSNPEHECHTRVDRSLLQEIHSAMDPLAERHQTQLEIKQLAAKEELLLAIPRVPLLRILFNLLKNAIENASLNSLPAERKVLLEIGGDPGGVSFTVQDSGPLMAPETEAKLFSLFIDSSKEGGAGLGLYGSQYLANQFAGKISYQKAHSKNAFVLNLPHAKPGEPS